MIENTFAPFNPALIRNYHFVKTNDSIKVQFIAIGDRHRMMKQDNGDIVFIKEREKGKPYRYGKPYAIQEALDILSQQSYTTHSHIAQHIIDNTPSS